MTEHTVTRTVTRIEEHTSGVDDRGLYVEEVDMVKVRQSNFECSCGEEFKDPEKVVEHLS